jgi:hypothetical protein
MRAPLKDLSAERVSIDWGSIVGPVGEGTFHTLLAALPEEYKSYEIPYRLLHLQHQETQRHHPHHLPNSTPKQRDMFCQMAKISRVTSFARPAHSANKPYKAGCKADVDQASGDIATACLPSRLISWFEPRLPLLPLHFIPSMRFSG